MKSLTSLSKRFRVSLALLTALATLPLGSTFQSAEAKPKSKAPAYGYRAKDTKVKKQKRNVRRDRDNDRDDRAQRRNDRNTARPNRRNDRFDDHRNSDRDDRDYVLRYRTRINSAGERYRQYFRVYTNR